MKKVQVENFIFSLLNTVGKYPQTTFKYTTCPFRHIFYIWHESYNHFHKNLRLNPFTEIFIAFHT